jgi:uncharacterized protein involved in response to NO
MFLSGAVMLLAGFALWALELAARAGVVPAPVWVLPPAWMHALLVLGGVFPFFILGFLFTAMPRWQGAPDLVRAQWLWPWRLLAAGWLTACVGLWLPGVLVAGLGLVMAGWAACLRLAWRIAYNEHPDALHARTVWWALGAAGLGLVAWFAFALGGNGTWARIAIAAGVWWFLVPVFFTVCHRMVPFFSSNVIPAYVMVRPRWALRLVVAASVVHGALAMADVAQFAWIADAPAAAVALWLSYKWRPLPALRVPLLGMLHLGFAWFGIALALFAVQNAAASLGQPALGLAPLHALGVGFFGSVLLAMVSRVTLGHAGLPLVADRLTWGLFIGLEVVVLVRVAADLVPSAWSGAFMLAAVLGWLAVFAAWGGRYLPTYWRARADGRPG